MFCDQCGARLEANPRFCSSCGKEVRGAVSFAAPPPGRVQSHIRLLGILWFALSAIDTMSGVAAIVVAKTIFSHQYGIQGIPMFLAPLMKGVALFSILKAAAGFATGWGLLNRQSWARPLAIAIGVVSLFFHIPFGTALGVYTLWVLLPAHSEQEYEKYQSVAAA